MRHEQALDWIYENLETSVRTANCIAHHCPVISKVGLAYYADGLADLRNVGQKTLREIHAILNGDDVI